MIPSFVSIYSFAFIGIESMEIEVQVHLAKGGPSFSIVGLANKSVSEAKQRVLAAFASAGIGIPYVNITVNLAPTDLVKDGSHFDLPIAAGLLIALDLIPREEIANYCVMGALALDSSVSGVNGVLPASVAAAAKRKGIICPYQNTQEAAWSGNPDIIPVKSLLELIQYLNSSKAIEKIHLNALDNIQHQEMKIPDLKDIKGQELAKKALEVGAAGGHNILMIGPAGSGKSMLAKCVPGLIPPMTAEEVLEVSIIASISGNINKELGLVSTRPYREPHSSASMPAIVGGGRHSKPGEVTLAHRGVLFLDELPEFHREVLESLRQPLESGKITVARANAHITYPADFMLIAAMNPCKCGNFGQSNTDCSKAPKCAMEYQARISGPLWDRFDICISVPNIDLLEYYPKDKYQKTLAEDSATVRKRIEIARNIQINRYKELGFILNARADVTILDQMLDLKSDVMQVLREYSHKFQLSGRSFYKILRVARTIADLAQEKEVLRQHVLAAISYRLPRIKSTYQN